MINHFFCTLCMQDLGNINAEMAEYRTYPAISAKASREYF